VPCDRYRLGPAFFGSTTAFPCSVTVAPRSHCQHAGTWICLLAIRSSVLTGCRLSSKEAA
jgi:hypothetical protein